MPELERLAAATGSRQALAIAHVYESDLCMRAGDYRDADGAIALAMQIAHQEGRSCCWNRCTGPQPAERWRGATMRQPAD